MQLREADIDDADSLAALINAACRVQDVVKIGDRIDAEGVRREMARGRLLVLDDRRDLAPGHPAPHRRGVLPQRQLSGN